MPTFRLNKLVRDGIVDHQIGLGQTPQYRELTPPEHKRALVLKVIEEAKELLNILESGGDSDPKPEVADTQQALNDFVASCGLTPEDIAEVQAARYAKMGGFGRGLYVETLEVPDGDLWVEYYRKEPERFKEL